MTETLNFLIAENFVQTESLNFVLISMLLSVVTGLAIATIHRFRSSHIVFDPQLNLSLLIITVIVTAVMIVIGSNLALSLGLIGALSIIRFRTAIKNPVDMAFIFWSVATGLALGSFNFLIAVSLLVLLGAVFTIAARLKYQTTKNDILLVLDLEGEAVQLDRLISEIEKISTRLETKSLIKNEEGLEATFSLKASQQQLITIEETLRQASGIERFSILHPNTNLYV